MPPPPPPSSSLQLKCEVIAVQGLSAGLLCNACSYFLWPLNLLVVWPPGHRTGPGIQRREHTVPRSTVSFQMLVSTDKRAKLTLTLVFTLFPNLSFKSFLLSSFHKNAGHNASEVNSRVRESTASPTK